MSGALRFFATAARGTEPALRDELRAAGLGGVRADRGGVHFEGGLRDGARACLLSRVAVRVLVELGRFSASGREALYDGVRSLRWRDHLLPRNTLAVSATCRDSALRHSHFVALVTKDAVVDQLRDELGARPGVDTSAPDVPIVVRLVQDEATVYLDLAGEPLHRRGYRREATPAVMKETLAAALLLLSGWRGEAPLVDPMCGSGTLALEGALLARRIAPGARRRFAFERWPSFGGEGRAFLAALREELRSRELPRAPVPIVALDCSARAIAATRANARAAGVAGDIDARVADVGELAPPPPGSLIATDPPYGVRLGGGEGSEPTPTARLAEGLRRCRGCQVTLLAGSPAIARAMRQRPDRVRTLYNGAIECRMLVYLL